MRYLRCLNRSSKYSRVESFNTMAEPTRRAGRMNRVHKPVMIRSQRAAWAPVCVRDLRSAADAGPARIRPPHCGALALTRLASAFLYGMTSRDPATFVLAISMLVVVTVLASYIPARRASNVD